LPPIPEYFRDPNKWPNFAEAINNWQMSSNYSQLGIKQGHENLKVQLNKPANISKVLK